MKKEMPLSLLKALESFLPQIQNEYFIIDKKGNALFRVEENDPKSNFYFEISSCEMRDAKPVVTILFKPRNGNSVEEYGSTVPLEAMQGRLNGWLQMLEEYRTVKTPFDDPILKKYEEEFEAMFVSADEDADTASFSLEQQFLLDDVLSEAIEKLGSKMNAANESIVNAFVMDAEVIRDSLTTSTKREILTNVSKWLAQIRKGGLKWLKEVLPIVQKGILGSIVDHVLQIPPSKNP